MYVDISNDDLMKRSLNGMTFTKCVFRRATI